MFGFGKGKIEIQIPQFNFYPGETIEGNVFLKVKKQIKAKAVTIKLIGINKTTKLNQNQQLKSASNYVYYFKQSLDGEKEYSGESSYNFKIKIPQNILAPPKFGTAFGTLIKSAQILTGQSSQIKWYLIASLEIPWGIDISKKIQINIT